MKNTEIQLFSGKTFDFLDLKPINIDISDIAHALSQLCRFNGHTDRFYSVAEHSLYVSSLVHPNYAIYGLLHDAAEAYIGDMTTPLKSAIKHNFYSDIFLSTLHRDILDIIAIRYDLDKFKFFDEEIKRVDKRMAVTEGERLMRNVGDWPDYHTGFRPYDMDLRCFMPKEAEMKFLKRFLAIYPGAEQGEEKQNVVYIDT